MTSPLPANGSMTAVLVAAELGFLLWLTVRASRLAGPARPFGPALRYLAWLAIYAVATSVLGARGVYIRDDVLASYPAFWLQGLTVAAIAGPVFFSPSLRQLLRDIFDHTPLHWFAAFHALRIAALGTAYKTHIGEFPVYFEVLVGIPDLAFGLSALAVYGAVKSGSVGARGFMRWNLIGALIIVPSAPVLLQLGLPGPLQVFTAVPDARWVFEFPMSVAPMFGVPLFVLVNLWAVWRLWERQRYASVTSNPSRS